jgi:hypothetical protein
MRQRKLPYTNNREGVGYFGIHIMFGHNVWKARQLRPQKLPVTSVSDELYKNKHKETAS